MSLDVCIFVSLNQKTKPMNTNPKPIEIKFYAVLVCLLIVLFVAFAADSSRSNVIADSDQQINETRLSEGYKNYKQTKTDTIKTNQITNNLTNREESK